MLARIIVSSGEWPLAWKKHWLHSLFKRGAQSDPSNFRGVHLTSQLSKVVERVAAAQLIIPWFEKMHRFSHNQFAYRRNMGHRDVLLINVAKWLLAFEPRQGILLQMCLALLTGCPPKG